jgi:hypothetical protein
LPLGGASGLAGGKLQRAAAVQGLRWVLSGGVFGFAGVYSLGQLLVGYLGLAIFAPLRFGRFGEGSRELRCYG